MKSTDHTLGRLSVTVDVSDVDGALALRPRIERFAWEMMPRVIERVADRIVPDDRVLALERLELDLGRVSTASLEEDGLAALERALVDELLRALNEADVAPSDDVRMLAVAAHELDLVASYLRSGTLRARSGSRAFDPGELLAALVTEQPDAFVEMLRRVAHDRHALERLVMQCDDTTLAAILGLLAPQDAAAILALLADVTLLQRTRPLERLFAAAEPDLTRVLRIATFEFLLRDAGSQFNRRAFLSFILRREATHLRIGYRDLLRALRASLRRVRARTGASSTLAILADLLEELDDEPSDADDARLLDLLRDALGTPRFDPLARRLAGRAFERAIAGLAPHDAGRMIAELDRLAARHDRSPFLPVTPIAFRRFARLFALRYLLEHDGERLSRSAFLRAFAEAVDAESARAWSATGLAATAPRARDEHPISSSPDAAVRSGATTTEQERAERLREIDPRHAPLAQAFLRDLLRLHAAQPLVTLDAERADAVLFEAATSALREGRARGFDRTRLQRRLLDALASAGGSTPEAVARAIAARVERGDASSTIASLRDEDDPERTARRRRIESYVRTGKPQAAGVALLAALADDRAWLAGSLRRIAREAPSEIPTLVEHVLDWLFPDELLAALVPELAEGALRHVDALGGRLRAWQRRLASATERVDSELAVHEVSALAWLDRLDEVAGELDRNEPSRVSAHRLEHVRRELVELSLAELTWIVLAEDRTRSEARLHRALEFAPELLDRLAPWARGLQPLALAVKAALAAIVGEDFDLAALQHTDLPAPASSADREHDGRFGMTFDAESALAGATPIDATRLFAWLDGAPVAAAERTILLHRLRALLDAQDPDTLAYFEARRTQARARARWAAELPIAHLGRVVMQLAPPGARALLDAGIAIAAAWRQVARFGAARPSEGEIWRMLLDRVAQPGPIDLTRAVRDLMHELAGEDRSALDALRDRTERLVRDRGHVTVAAALRRSAPPNPPPQSPARAQSLVTSAESSEPLYVGNAGLVLFAPFLPTLFERIGVLSRERDDAPARVNGIEAASRAVHLLQYLADGRLDRPEPELVLNKVLAGVAIAAPVHRFIEASAEDLSICDDLLHAVLANWPAMRKTAPEGLRETFLRRQGRLQRGDGRWSLVVQRKTLDVLLEQLPWGYSVIVHRWMSEPLHVTW